VFEQYGLYAMGGVLIGFWQQIRSFISRLTQYAVERHTSDSWASLSLQTYLMAHAKRHRFGTRAYDGHMLFVQPVGRVITVGCEKIGTGTTLFWLNNRPIWVSKANPDERGSNPGSPTPSNGPSNPFLITMYWLRGTFDADQLHIDAINYVNANTKEHKHRRHCINHITGSVGKQFQGGDGGHSSTQAAAPSDPGIPHTKTYRYLRWTDDDLLQHSVHVKSIDLMSLTPELLELYEEIKDWFASEQWCREHNVPWQFGIKLEGLPGTGKTAFIRAIAEDLDMPVYIYNLPTLMDDELLNVWHKMLAQAPCIALFEDMDGVFHHRKPQGKTALSFDTLLNVLSGVERANGLLVCMTTNKPEVLDDALVRKGRIDRTIVMPKLTADGRRKMAARILSEYPAEQLAAVTAGADMTGAEFQDECITRARALRRAAKGFKPAEWESRSEVLAVG
jgi:hypothetical protein